MGIIYIILIFCYIAISKFLYNLFKKYIENRFIKLLLILFFILFPTHDIILGHLFKYFYANFTTNEIVYKKIDKPEVVLIDDYYLKKIFNNKSLEKKETYLINEIQFYSKIFKLKRIQIKLDNELIKEFYIENNTIKEKEIEKESIIKVIIKDADFPIIINKYLNGTEKFIFDGENKIAFSRDFVNINYNFDFFLVFKNKEIRMKYLDELFIDCIK